MDFSKFDAAINKEELKKQIDAAGDQTFDEVPKGTYIVSIEKMEVKPTKLGDGLNFSVQMKIVETVEAPKKQDGRWIFFNRKIAGNKTSDKWNDGKAIANVCGWINKLLDGNDIEFKSYSDFADEVLDIYQDLAGKIELQVDYDPDAFNSVSITDIFDK